MIRYLDTRRPRLFGHRGACGTFPENTLASFEAGVAADVDILELDVHATRDGEVVVLHDPTVDRTTDGSGPVCGLSLAELARLDAGHGFVDADGGHPYRGQGLRIPTLADVLERFPMTPLNIEIKQGEPSIEAAVLAVLDRHDARGRVLLAAEHQAIMTRIRELAAGVLTSFSAEEVVDFVGACAEGRGGYRPPGVALQVPTCHGDIEIVNAGFVDAAHALGVEVHVWTINDPDQMRELLALGVDGFITDFPARGREVIEAAGV